MRAQYRVKPNYKWLYYRCMTRELKGECPHPGAWVNESELIPQIESIIAQFKLPDNWLDVLNEMLTANSKSKAYRDDRAK